ncbi:tetratricopeptide repeat protein [Acidobacterium capsulatum]|uniref:Peptidase, family M1 n=2 Tax=Acidobacterium TaxID=33973 RepID=C1F717_ACIC5|nr:tetratricopeptide repeat protein [Acidobacterium capsulatum]ACO34040.1 peptidase, family M1 [Acidobacterium capsulatum ATCC 51196]
MLLAATSARAQYAAQSGTPLVDVTGYVIDATVQPARHSLAATAQVTFTPTADLPTASFVLHDALRVQKVADASGNAIPGERGPNDTLLLTPATPLVKGQSYTWTFTYAGQLDGSATSGPVPGLTLAKIDADTSYLLYGGAWFPMDGYLTDRFTATLHITVPSGYTVVGSGAVAISKTDASGMREYDFAWTKPSFPGTILVGKWVDVPDPQAANIHLYVSPAHQKAAEGSYGTSALDEFAFFTSTFGEPPSNTLNIVELPNGTVPAYWAPGIAAIASAHIGGGNDARLLANTIAHQWWSAEVSPATLNDAWITNGMCTYAELLYLEYQDGEGALANAIQDVAAGALAYDTTPLTSAGRLGAFSPQFQSMTFEKGAMVFHMLRWVMGNDSFNKALQAVLTEYAGKDVSTAQFEKAAEAHTQQNLVPFFAEWLDGTGAPDFKTKWDVYRLGNGKGFRTVGAIEQQLDLLNMPVDVRIETQGKTVNHVVQVVGNSTPFDIETFGEPSRISIDPDWHVLKDTPDMQVRVDILRGQQKAAQGDVAGALAEYQAALKVNPQSSLASFRMGELLFAQHDYQAAVNAYRDALSGDNQPKWTEAWSHIEIGKIFDITGQRDRAVNEYRQALETHDNTSGAMNEARHDIQVPYKLPGAGS